MQPSQPLSDFVSEVSLTKEFPSKSPQKSHDPGAALPRLLQRFAERVCKYAAMTENAVRKNPCESICLALVVIGVCIATGGIVAASAAILITVGAFIAGVSALALVYLICSDSRKTGDGSDENRIVVDLDDPDAAWIDPTHSRDIDSPEPQLEVAIDLKPAKVTDHIKDFDNLICEISGREN